MIAATERTWAALRTRVTPGTISEEKSSGFGGGALPREEEGEEGGDPGGGDPGGGDPGGGDPGGGDPGGAADIDLLGGGVPPSAVADDAVLSTRTQPIQSARGTRIRRVERSEDARSNILAMCGSPPGEPLRSMMMMRGGAVRQFLAG
jgi:hypothetical protein